MIKNAAFLYDQYSPGPLPGVRVSQAPGGYSHIGPSWEMEYDKSKRSKEADSGLAPPLFQQFRRDSLGYVYHKGRELPQELLHAVAEYNQFNKIKKHLHQSTNRGANASTVQIQQLKPMLSPSPSENKISTRQPKFLPIRQQKDPLYILDRDVKRPYNFTPQEERAEKLHKIFIKRKEESGIFLPWEGQSLPKSGLRVLNPPGGPSRVHLG